MRRREFLAATAAGAVAGISQPAAAAPDLGRTLIYLAALPNRLLMFDELDQKVVDQVVLPTGVGRILTLSTDRKKIFVSTWPRCGFDVIDRATFKVVNTFKLDLDNNTRRMWLRGF